jgi:hypothetical protein
MAIALSWSRVSDFLQCPRKFFLKYVTKGFPPEDASKSVHLVKGSEMHKQMELYTYSKINGVAYDKPASPACKDAFPMVDRIFDTFDQVWPERQVAVNGEWKPDEWFGKQVAWRSIWDLSAVSMKNRSALLIDWKTGKVQDYGEEEPGQLHLSAAMAMDVLGVDEVTIFYAFLEFKVKKPEGGLKLTRELDYQPIRQHFTQIYDKVNVEKEWKPTVNQYCNYCPATKAQCQFSRKVA